jgi:hypothetical protein
LLELLKVSSPFPFMHRCLYLPEVVVEVAIVKKLGSQIKHGLELWVWR